MRRSISRQAALREDRYGSTAAWHSRVHDNVSASEFEIIAENSQIASVQAFMYFLPTIRRG